MKLYKDDIKKIGHTTWGEHQTTRFVCSGQTYRLESLLLREILKLFDAEILSERDSPLHDGDIVIETNLSWDEYMKM